MTTSALVNVFVPMPDDPTASASAARVDAEALVVQSDASYTLAGSILLDIKARRKALDDERKKLVQPVDEARERIQALFRGPLLDLDDCERVVKRKLVEYQNAVEARRRDEQAKADEAARRERERIEAQADRAAAAGKHERAEQLAERAATIAPPILHREVPKVAGVSTREVWLFEVVDESQVPLEYRPVDLGMVGKVVRALKSAARIPGVRVYADRAIAAGGGK